MIFVRNSFVSILGFVFVLSLSFASRANAEATLGDATLTVALSTVAGAVLGASTLPFYEESSEHTQNIFYGAAIGAVVGVFISAYAGVKDGPGYDDAHLAPPKPSAVGLNQASAFRLHPEITTATRKPATFANGDTLAWAPVASLKF